MVTANFSDSKYHFRKQNVSSLLLVHEIHAGLKTPDELNSFRRVVRNSMIHTKTCLPWKRSGLYMVGERNTVPKRIKSRINTSRDAKPSLFHSYFERVALAIMNCFLSNWIVFQLLIQDFADGGGSREQWGGGYF